MSVMSDDLVAFLAARLDEDEADIDTRAHDSGQCDYLRGVHLEPERALREVEVKRAILRRCEARMNEPDQWPNGLVSPRALLARQTLMDLAAIYNDHPEYRTEWKP